MARKLKDIENLTAPEAWGPTAWLPDMHFVQRKISAAGDLRKAAQELIEAYETGVPPNIWLRKINSLKKNMERFANVE